LCLSESKLPREDPAALAQKLLDVPVDAMEHALQTKLTDGTVVADTSVGRVCMFLSSLHALVLVNDRSPSWPVAKGRARPPGYSWSRTRPLERSRIRSSIDVFL
jgi:hypothetical protein